MSASSLRLSLAESLLLHARGLSLRAVTAVILEDPPRHVFGWTHEDRSLLGLCAQARQRPLGATSWEAIARFSSAPWRRRLRTGAFLRFFLGLREKLPVVSPKLSFDPIAEARRQWNRHWGRGATPSMSAVTSVMRMHQILMARLNAVLEPYELTFPRYEALMLLFYSRRGSLPLGKMGDRLQVHRTSVTNTIDGLERLGYVERVPHEEDRRTTLARITKRGRDVADLATRALNQERFGTAPLGSNDLELVSEILRRVRIDAGDFEEGVSAASAGR